MRGGVWREEGRSAEYDDERRQPRRPRGRYHPYDEYDHSPSRAHYDSKPSYREHYSDHYTDRGPPCRQDLDHNSRPSRFVNTRRTREYRSEPSDTYRYPTAHHHRARYPSPRDMEEDDLDDKANLFTPQRTNTTDQPDEVERTDSQIVAEVEEQLSKLSEERRTKIRQKIGVRGLTTEQPLSERDSATVESPGKQPTTEVVGLHKIPAGKVPEDKELATQE